MKLLCGLGNPGAKYEGSRHNAGFIFIDEYAKENDFPAFQEKWNALVSEKGTGEGKVFLIKPLTFMNLSGEAVSKFVNFYKIPLEDLIIIYDDIDLSLGTIRFRNTGSAGTHNGMKSIIQHLGSDQFPRLRLGVESRGEELPKEMDLAAFVLAPFSASEQARLKEMLVAGMKELENKLA